MTLAMVIFAKVVKKKLQSCVVKSVTHRRALIAIRWRPATNVFCRTVVVFAL